MSDTGITKLLKPTRNLNDYVYTDWHSALSEINKRKKDSSLLNYVEKILGHDGVPKIMQEKISCVFFRHIATLNYETLRFLMHVDMLKPIQTIIFELHQDKFTDLNSLKKSLGKLPIYKKHNKHNEPTLEYRTIVDMSKCNGKRISSLVTHSGESLVDFHHSLLFQRFPELKDSVYDLSAWLGHDGENVRASEWYKKFLTLFLVNGILFENFLTSGTEADFTNNVMLPAFTEIEAESGYKPIVVALVPPHEEANSRWECYPCSLFEKIK